jgi:hypothetical protein
MRPALLLLSGLLLLSARAAAEPTASPANVCAGRGSALSEVACELAHGLGDKARGALVVGVTPVAEPPVAVRPELGAKAAALVAGALAHGATASPQTEPAARARSLADGTRPLVVVTTRIVEAGVEASADVFVGRETLWRRVRKGRSGPMAHAFAARPLDAEVRSYLPVVPLVAREIVKATGADSDTVAVACGDLGADGSSELVLVGRRKIVVARIEGGKLRRLTERTLAELSPIAPAPLREPIATAWFSSPTTLDVGLTDRAFALRLDARLEKVTAFGGALPWPGAGCAPLAELGVGAKISACGLSLPSAEALGEGPFDAVAGAVIVDRQGRSRLVRAGRLVGMNTAAVSEGRLRAAVDGVGAQLAVADLDGDGAVELVSSLDTRDPKLDAVVVRTVFSAQSVTERFRLAVPSGVRALGVCPPRAGSMNPVVVATGDSVWIIR